MPKDPDEQRPAEKSWYYLLEDERYGPVPVSQLRRLLQSGELGPDTLVWRQGMKDWVPARSLTAGTAQRTPNPPPRPAIASIGAGREDKLIEASRRTARRWPWALTGALAATVILVCGVGIGYLLRPPAQPSGAVADASPTQTPEQTARVAQSPPALSGQPAPPSSTRPTRPASAPRDPIAGSIDSAPMPATTPLPRQDGATSAAGDAASATPAAETTHLAPPSTQATPSGGATTLYQVVDIQRRSSGGIEGMMMTQEMRYQILTRLETGPRQPDKSRNVQQTIEQVRLGAADEMSRATLEAELQKMVGRTYSFTLNERDEITKFTGFQSTTAHAPIARPEQTGFLVATVMDEDGWKELMERSFLRPPETAAGQAWRRPVNHRWGPLGHWRGTTTYTPRGPEGYGMRYDFTNEMSYVPPEPTAGVLPFDVAGAEFRPLQAGGSFVFDAQHGHVISVHEVFHVQGAVAAALMGSTARIQVEEYQEFVVQISNQNPWQQ